MEFCYKSATIWQIVGKIIFMIKIIVPILIIVLASIDLGKATISSDDKAISKAGKTLLRRIVTGIIIFFIPLLIKVLFNMIAGFNEDIKNDYENCVVCLTDPYNECDTSYKGEIFTK